MKAKPNLRPHFLLATVLSLTMGATAAVLTWDGADTILGAEGGTGTWNVNSTANWWNGSSDVVWPALGGIDNDAVFANTAGTVTLGTPITANDLTFSTTGYIVTGNTLTLNGATPTITTDPGVTATINSVVAGGVGLRKAGTGTLILSGVNNTYTGGTTVNAGTLQAMVNTSVSSIGASAASIATGATLQLDSAYVAGGTLTVANTFTGTGTLRLNFAANATARNTVLSGVAGFNGNIRLSSAGATGDKWTVTALTASNASVTVENGTQLFISTGTSTFAGVNVIGTGNSETRGAIRLAGTLVGPITMAGSATIGTEGGTISGNILGGAAGTNILTLGTTNSVGGANLNGIIGGGTGTIGLTKTAAGTVVLGGVNTYTGVTTVSGGVLSVATIGNGGVAGNLGQATNAAANLVLDGGTLRYTGATASTDRNFTITAAKTGFIDVSTAATVLTMSGGAAATTGILNKTGAGTLILSGNNLHTGGTTVTAGELQALAVVAAGAKSHLGAGLVTVGAGTTLRIKSASTANGHSYANNFALNGGTFISEDAVVTYGGTVALTGTNTIQVVHATKNALFTNAISGAGGIIKTGAGEMIVSGSSGYLGTTNISGGGFTLNGANGALAATTGITLGANTILKLENGIGANLGNRLNDAATITMSGANLQFTHPGSAATNFSETTGGIVLNGGANTLAASQANGGQTSALTTPSLTRSAGGLVNFTGTGLGADARNQILITANPTLTNGIIGLWATYNGSSLASYDAALGVIGASHTDVTRLNSGSNVITNFAENNVRIIEGTGIAAANLTLGSAVTTINSLYQTTSGGSSAAVIDTAGQTLRLGATAGILTQAGAGSLTVGLPVNSGILTAGGVDNTAGLLTVQANSANGITINSAITNNGTGVVGLTLEGIGSLTLSGAANNTYTGMTTLAGTTNQLVLAKTGGAVAIGGDITMSSSGTRSILSAAQNNQFATGSVMRFAATSVDTRFELKGTTQTLGGIDSTGFTGPTALIQHSEFGSPAAVSGLSTLILDVTGANAYTFGTASGSAGLRDMGGVLALTKNGTGTQTLVGGAITYSGATLLNAGTLRLSATNSASAVRVNPSATLIINGLNTNTTAAQFITLNGGTLVTDENNGFVVNNKLLTVAASSAFNISGTGTTTNVSQWFADAGITIAAGQTLTLNPSTVNNGLVVRSSAGISNGALIVNGVGTTSLPGRANLQFSTAGAAQFSNTDVTLNNATMNIGQGANNDVNASGATVKSLSGNGAVVSDAVARTLTIGTNNGSGNFSGTLANGTQTLSLTKTGSGTQTLSGTNTYTGVTTVNAGNLLLDFAAGGTSNILSSSTALVLGGGQLEIKGGAGETNTQTFNGVSGFGSMQLTPNGATSLDVTLGAISSVGAINFVGSNATVGALGTANFLTSTTTSGSDGTAILGGHLWNGSNWASTSSAGGNHVVGWVGIFNDLTTDGNSANPTGDLRILDGAAAGTAATFSANTVVNSLLAAAPTYASTIALGTNTLTLGNGVSATGAIAIGSTAKSLTVGTAANQGTLTAGTSGPSALALNNQNPSATLTINSVLSNNAAGGVVSLATDGVVLLNGANTFTGVTTISSGTLEIGGAGSLGGGTYAGAITNNATLLYGSSVNQLMSGVISGTGALTKTGAATLTLSNNQTYTGATTVSNGTLVIGNGGTTGGLAGAIINNANLTFFRNDAAQVNPAGVISGTGNVTYNGPVVAVSGQGQYLLDDANTYSGTTTVGNARINVAHASGLGTGSVVVNPGGQIYIAIGSTFSNPITINGNGWTEGAGTLGAIRLNNNPTLTGPITMGSHSRISSYGGSGIINGVISGAFDLEITGLNAGNLITFGGASSNTFGGTTTLTTGSLGLSKTGGAHAIPGNFVGRNEGSSDVYTTIDNQFAPGSVMSFNGTSGDHLRFELLGTTQTLAGVENSLGTTRGVIQHREQVAAASVGGLSTLVLNGSGTYSFNGFVRDTGGRLALTKNGTGTQTLAGVNISYTGTTTVNNGTLKLTDTTAFASPIYNAATVEFNSSIATSQTTRMLSGAGTFNKTGTGIFKFFGGQLIATSGKFNVIAGTLQNDGNAVNWSGSTADIDVSSGAILDLYADSIFVDQLTGSGFVQNNFGNTLGAQSGSAAFFERLVLGVANGDALFSGVIRNNASGVTPAAGANNGGLELLKVGTGTQTLSGANLYTGLTAIQGGTLSLDFQASAGTSNILSASTTVLLGGGTLEIKGGGGEANTQTVNGVSGLGTLKITPNGAASMNVTLGAIGFGAINFTGSDATVGALGNANFLTTTTTPGSDGTAILGGHLWNGSNWASTSSAGGNHVVGWAGTFNDLTTDGNSANPIGDLRILDGTAAGTAATFSANTVVNSLLVAAPTYASTIALGTNTLTLGNGVSATGAIAIGSTAKSLTVGTAANQGTLTAGTSGPSALVLNNQNATSTLTINSAIANNTGAGAVSLTTSGGVILNGNNTYTGTTMISGGTLEMSGASSLGGGSYAAAISNSGVFRYNSSANQILSGGLSGAGSLVKDNAGSKLTLNGTGVTYSGSTTINAGTVDWQNVTNIGAGTITINAGGTLTASQPGTYSDLNGLVVLNGASITASAPGNVANYGNFRLRNDVVVGGTQQSLISADVRLGESVTRNFNVADTGDASGIDLEITGTFTHWHGVTAGYLNKTGAGVMRFNNPLASTAVGFANALQMITVSEGKVIFANYIGAPGAVVAESNGTVDLNPGTNQSIPTALHGVGVFNKEGNNDLTLTSSASTMTGTLNVNSGKLIAGAAGSTGMGNVVVKAGATLQSNGPDYFGYASNTAQITIQGGTVTTNSGGAYRNVIPKLVFDGGGLLTSGAGNSGSADGQYLLYNNGATSTTVNVINPGSSTATISSPIFTLSNTLTSGTTFNVARGTAGSDLTISSSLRTQGNVTPVIKTGAGILTLSGANTFVGSTTVSQGTLIGTTTTALGALNNALTVATGATFAYQGSTVGALNMGNGLLTMAAGSRLGTSLGGALSQSAITSSAAAVTTGAITVDLYGISDGTVTATGTHNLLTAASGLTSGGASYTLGNIYNPTNFTVNPGTFNQTNTAISIGVTSATPLAAAYWKGGFAGDNNVWAVSNGSTASNWASDASGTDTPLVPGASSIVHFSATGATNQGAMILGANMHVAGIVVNDTNAISLNQAAGNLTLGSSGITVNSGAGAVSINTGLSLSGSQTWSNNGSNTLTLAGEVNYGNLDLTVSGSGNSAVTGVLAGSGSLVKTGAGILTLSAPNLNTGTIILNAGILRAGSVAGGRAFGTLNPVILANAAGALLDLNNFNQTVGSIAGGGAAGGNIALGSGTLTTGQLNTSTTYNGVISGSGGLTKVGTGSMTINGTNSYTGTTMVNAGVLNLNANAPTVLGSVIMNGPDGTFTRTQQADQFGSGVVANFSSAPLSWNRLEFFGKNQTLAGINTGNFITQGGGVIQNSEANGAAGADMVLTLNGSGTYLFNGHLRDYGATASGINKLSLTKNGSGTQTLVGSVVTHSGPTTINTGKLILSGTSAYNSANTINSGGILQLNPTGANVNNISTTVNAGGLLELNSTNAAGIANRRIIPGLFTGAGTVNVISAPNTWLGVTGTIALSGTINVNSGVFHNDSLTANWSANTADMMIASGAEFHSRGQATTLGGLNGSGLLLNDNTSAIAVVTVGAGDKSGSFSGTIRGNNTGVSDGDLERGFLALTKIGSGTQVLSGSNTYTGTTTVNGGTLVLDFAAGGTSNILAAASTIVLGNGATLEIKGGSGEANTQTVNGVSGTGTLLLTQNGASSVNVTLGAIGAGAINFAGSDATVGALGVKNFLTSTTTAGDNGTTKLGGHLWNGSDWASTSSTGGNHVVAWSGTYSVIYNGTDPGSVAIPTGMPTAEVQILEATSGHTNNTLAASTTINSLLMSAGGTTATVNLGGNTLTVGNGVSAVGPIAIATAGKSLTIGATVNDGVLTAGTSGASSLVFNNQNAASTLSINSVIANNAGAGVVSLTTTGNVLLTGTNTFTGTTTISAGSLEIGGTGTLGSGTYVAAINNGGVLRYNSTTNQALNGLVSGSGSLVKDGVGSTLTLNQNNTFTGGVTVNQGTLMLASTDDGTSTIKGVVTVNASGTLDWSVINPLGYNAGSITSLNINGGTVGGADLRTHYYHNAGTIPINMTGGILKLGGISTVVGDMNQFRSAPITVIASGATAQILGVTGAAAMGIRDGTAQTFNVGNGSQAVDLLVDVIVSQNGAGGSVIKNGAGTMQFTKNNGYTGNTTINEGVLDITSGGIHRTIAGADSYNNTAVVQVNAGATLRLKSFAYNGEGGTGGLADYRQRRVLNGGALEVTGASHASGNDFTVTSVGGTFRYSPSTITDTLTLNGNSNTNIQLDGTVNFDTVGNVTVNEQLDGVGGLTKTGSQILTLNGIHTYTGTTTVNAGTLVVGSGSSIATSSLLTVNSGAVLAGTGTVGNTVLAAGAEIRPGNSPGILTTNGNFTVAGAATFVMDLAGTTPGTQHDQLDITGIIDLGTTSILSLNITSAPAVGDKFFLILNDGSDPISGLFAGINNGAEFSSGGYVFSAHYNADSGSSSLTGGNDFALYTVVPEPTHAFLLLTAAGGLVLRRRRQL